MSRKKIMSLLAMLGVTAMLIIFCIVLRKTIQKHDIDKSTSGETQYDFAMGTVLSATIYGDDISKELFDCVKSLDDEVISWRMDTSLLAKLNSEKTMKFDISDSLEKSLFDAIICSYGICKRTDGALDITLRPLLNTWGIEDADEKTFVVPSDDEIKDSLKNVSYEKISIDGESVSLEQNMVIDLGATGKGYALDEIYTLLEKSDVEGATFCVGGSIICYGSKPDNSSWHVGIRNPWGAETDYAGYLEIKAGKTAYISTSGDYEKYVEKNKKRYHHILDRNTGYPADSRLVSVTVVCYQDSCELPGLCSDGLSTACFVLGYEKSLDILKEYNADAIFIDQDGNITVTDGLVDSFTKN